MSRKAAAPHEDELQKLPTVRQILLAWVLLMALTIGTMLAGKVTSAASLGIVWTAVLLVITWAKARIILAVYLNLRAAPRYWQSGFGGTLFVLLLILLGIYAFGFFDMMPRR